MIRDREEITRGLIIAKPWISLVLAGEKTWEMRTSNTSVRGPIALIEKGSGTIVGTAIIQDSIGPLSSEEISDHEEKHRVGAEVYSRGDYRWKYAWILVDVKALEWPVPYKHKNGAVIWVDLDLDARKQLGNQSRKQSTTEHVESQSPDYSRVKADEITPSSPRTLPFAKDGTFFCPQTCSRNGIYIVGEKGDEQRFSSYSAALGYLRKMPTAKWRRPNPKGNWGIVSAVKWESV